MSVASDLKRWQVAVPFVGGCLAELTDCVPKPTKRSSMTNRVRICEDALFADLDSQPVPPSFREEPISSHSLLPTTVPQAHSPPYCLPHPSTMYMRKATCRCRTSSLCKFFRRSGLVVDPAQGVMFAPCWHYIHALCLAKWAKKQVDGNMDEHVLPCRCKAQYSVREAAQMYHVEFKHLLHKMPRRTRGAMRWRSGI